MSPRLFSYVVTHDSGFAPNPYVGVLTLAACKPRIRATARSGDWLLGTGSVKAVGTARVVYAAIVSEVLALEQYSTDPRFVAKHPGVGRQPWQRDGDNIYSRLADGTWRQRRNIHHGLKHMARDLSGKNVLVCSRFWYFGRSAPVLPEGLLAVVKRGPGHKCEDSLPLIDRFATWLDNFPPGITGRPFMLEEGSRKDGDR